MTEIQYNIIKDIVKNFLLKNPRFIESAFINEDIINHVIHTGTDILAHKWKIQTGGNFVQAVVDNNLTQTYMRADVTNEQFIKFYVMLIYNTSKPSNL